MRLNQTAARKRAERLPLAMLPSLLGGVALLLSCRMSAQGRVVVRAWGSASNGEVGNGGDKSQELPAPVRLSADARAVSAGWNHSLALKADGTVWAWGSNSSCQAGKKDALYLTLPIKVAGIADSRAIAAGGSHSLALKADGTVWAWGGNAFGQLGSGITTSRFHSGKPVGGPDGRPEPGQVKGLTNVTAIAAGSIHSLALKADGTVWAWGCNVWGELGTGTRKFARSQRNSAPQAGARAKSVWFRRDPDAEPGACNLPILVEGMDQVTAIAAGPDTGFAIRKDGTLWNWGVISRKPSARGSYTYSAIPVQIKELSHVIAVAPGATHTLALTADGAVWAWGSNVWGELGNGTLDAHEAPMPVAGLNSIVAIAAGNGHSAALDSHGKVWTWGYNTYGELGDGTHINRQTPTVVGNLTQAIAISAGQCHCLALARSEAADKSDVKTPGDKMVRAAGADATGAVAYKTYYEVDPFHWSNRAVQELRGNDVIPLYNDRYYNLIKREQYALNIQRGLDYSVFGKPGPKGAHFPADDPQSIGRVRRGTRKTLWPEEARLLLRLLREYRPDVEALWKQSNRDVGELAEAEQRLAAAGRETPPLDTPVTGLKMTNAAVEEVYTELVQNYHLALSLIQTKANTPISIDVQAGTVRDVLDQIMAQATAYRLRTVHGRLILMPSEPRFETVLTEPTFANAPRIEAKDRYCEYLSKNVAGFADLIAPTFIMGDAYAPILTDPITLRGKTTVLERFVQLLGKNPRACFYIHRHHKLINTDISLFYINQAPRAVDELGL